VGGGLGWFYYLYHKNINKTLILQNFYDDFLRGVANGRQSLSGKVGVIQNYALNSPYHSAFVNDCNWATDLAKEVEMQLVLRNFQKIQS
jgi:hypothetical protein